MSDRLLQDTGEGEERSTNTSPLLELQEEEEISPLRPAVKLLAIIADTQVETLQPESLDIEDTSIKTVDPPDDQNIEAQPPPANIEEDGENNHSSDRPEKQDKVQEDQMSRTSQDAAYQTAIDDDYDSDDTIQFTNPVRQPFLSRSIRVLTTEVGCLSFTQMFQEYLEAYQLKSQTKSLESITEMADRLNIYLNRYPAKHTNCMTADSEFVAFVNHATQLALDLTTYPTIWAVLLLLLETQDVNTTYVQTIPKYHNGCYSMNTRDYMVEVEKVAEIPKNMYSNLLHSVSACVQQNMCRQQLPMVNQHDDNTANHTQILHDHNADDIMTEYPSWSTETDDIENTNLANYKDTRREILTVWQKDTPVKIQDNSQVLHNVQAYARDRLNIAQSLNHRLGLGKVSLLGAQEITVATVQADPKTTEDVNAFLNMSLGLGESENNDIDYDREEELLQVDGTADSQLDIDNSHDIENNDNDNNAHKKPRKQYAEADVIRKQMTKDRKVQLLKKQQEKNLALAQAAQAADEKAKQNKPNRPKPPTKSKGKVMHPDQIKSSQKGKKSTTKNANDQNDPPSDIQLDSDSDIMIETLIGDDVEPLDDSENPLAPNEVGMYTFFIEGQATPL